MEGTGKLRLDLLDVHGDPLAERVDVYLRHQTLSETKVARGVPASKRVVITGLLGSPQGLYRVEIDPPSYLPVSYFINIQAAGFTDRTIFFAVDPRKVVWVDFPEYEALPSGAALLARSRAVLGYEGKAGPQLYEALDDIRRAGLLNILAKCGRTRLTDGATVLDQLLELRELRGDRFFCAVPKTLRESVKNSVREGLFDAVSGLLHRPPDGFQEAGSFKTPDGYGNLQLTFFSNGTDWLADIDIDDAGGLEHAFQVLRNAVTGRPTHPYDIHQILIRHQELDPGYRLMLQEKPA
jgi:hypothetical protein